jgi:hypothetical protein
VGVGEKPNAGQGRVITGLSSAASASLTSRGTVVSMSDDDDRVKVPEGTDPDEFLRKLLQVDPDDQDGDGDEKDDA